MVAFLVHQAPWWLAGPLLGLCVVAMFATINERLGVLGGFSDVVERLSAGSLRIGWKGSFLVGVIGGGLLFALVSARPLTGDGYGWLTRSFPAAVTIALLVAAGALIGYGAKSAGGCTSGNGLCGVSIGSRASFAATGTFMATAVAASLVTEWMFGA